MSGIVVLAEAECRRLIRSCSVGRVAVNRRGHGPLVVPVNYGVDPAGAIVFCTDPGTKLARIPRGAVSFQIDAFDHAARAGWSVLVDGLAHEATLDDASAAGVDSWTSSSLRHAVRIVPTRITGRRVVRSIMIEPCPSSSPPDNRQTSSPT